MKLQAGDFLPDIDGAARASVSPDIGAFESTHTADTQDYVYLEIESDGTGGAPLILNAHLSATLQALVDGSATITWQWTLNGVAIPGADSSTLTVNPFTGADSGDYQAIATIDGQPYTLTTYTVPGPILALDSETCSDNVVVDPSFEDYTLDAWTGDLGNIVQYDPFGAPDAAPLIGDFFLWLGNYDSPTIASVSQSVVIPATGNATLEFYLHTEQASAAYGTMDQFDVTIDGTSVLPDGAILAADATYQDGYTRVSVDVSAYADGKAHVLRFETIQTGSTIATDLTNFIIDEISISTGTICVDNWGIDIAPGFLHLGRVANSASKQMTFSVVNTGATPLVGSIQVEQPFGSTTTPYSIVESPADYNIPQGGSATFTVDFTPIEDITARGTLWFTGGGGFGMPLFGFTDPATPFTNIAADVIITEVLAWNTKTLLDGEGDTPAWIELKNYNDFAVNLAGWKLTHTSNGVTDPDWVLPDIDIPPNDYLIVFASAKLDPLLDSGLHASFALNKDNGGSVVLARTDNSVTEQSPAYAAAVAPDESYAYDDTPGPTNSREAHARTTAAGNWVGAGIASPLSALLTLFDDTHFWRPGLSKPSGTVATEGISNLHTTDLRNMAVKAGKLLWYDSDRVKYKDEKLGEVVVDFRDNHANTFVIIEEQPGPPYGVLALIDSDLTTADIAPGNLTAARRRAEESKTEVLLLSTFPGPTLGTTFINVLTPDMQVNNNLKNEFGNYRVIILYVDDISTRPTLPENVERLGTVLAHELGHFAGLKGHPKQINWKYLLPTPNLRLNDMSLENRLMGVFDETSSLGFIRPNEVPMYQGRWDFHAGDPISPLNGFPPLVNKNDGTMAVTRADKMSDDFLFTYMF